jgi:hypothetical protein
VPAACRWRSPLLCAAGGGSAGCGGAVRSVRCRVPCAASHARTARPVAQAAPRGPQRSAGSAMSQHVTQAGGLWRSRSSFSPAAAVSNRRAGDGLRWHNGRSRPNLIPPDPPLCPLGPGWTVLTLFLCRFQDEGYFSSICIASRGLCTVMCIQRKEEHAVIRLLWSTKRKNSCCRRIAAANAEGGMNVKFQCKNWKCDGPGQGVLMYTPFYRPSVTLLSLLGMCGVAGYL